MALTAHSSPVYLNACPFGPRLPPLSLVWFLDPDGVALPGAFFFLASGQGLIVLALKATDRNLDNTRQSTRLEAYIEMLTRADSVAARDERVKEKKTTVELRLLRVGDRKKKKGKKVG